MLSHQGLDIKFSGQLVQRWRAAEANQENF